MTAPHDAHDHDHPDIPDPELIEVSEGVHAYVQLDGSWGLNNCGALVGAEGIIAIDTCFTVRRTAAYLDAISALSERPVRTLVNTHHHGDHTHGNFLLPDATIIGHDKCREEVLASGHLAQFFFGDDVDWGDISITPPFVTFDDTLTVWVDDLKVELIFVGPAHTTNDIVCWLPERRVLFAGDLVFNGGTPFVVMGSVTGSIAALERLRDLEPDVVVPGHGAICDAGAFDDQSAYLRLVQNLAADGFASGTSVLDLAASADLGPFATLSDPERIVGNLHRAYLELQGDPLGTPVDPQAFTDMITFNGGPMRCLA